MGGNLPTMDQWVGWRNNEEQHGANGPIGQKKYGARSGVDFQNNHVKGIAKVSREKPARSAEDATVGNKAGRGEIDSRQACLGSPSAHGNNGGNYFMPTWARKGMEPCKQIMFSMGSNRKALAPYVATSAQLVDLFWGWLRFRRAFVWNPNRLSLH